MQAGLTIGATAELHWQVSAEHVIHLGYPPPSISSGLVQQATAPQTTAVVFSTPNMILLMERAARKVIDPFLEAGEESVGAKVDVEHLAGTPIGSHVRGVARVTKVDGRLVDFEIAAFDRFEQIGRGTHRRAVVRLSRVAERIREKADKVSNHASPLTWYDGIATHELASSIQTPALSEATMPLPQLTTLDVQVDGAIATVTMNRPAKKNAVNVEMTGEWEQLNTYLWQHPEIRVVLLTGAGNAFSAGDDVPEVGTLDLPHATELSYRQARAYLAWEQLPQVFLAAIDGEALGAGCVIACACDLRIATHASVFGMPEVLLGWPPGYGVAQLTGLVGKSRAMQLCLTGDSITASQALEWGLVHRITAANGLSTKARKWAETLLSLSPEALRETKRAVHAAEGIQPKIAFLGDTAAYIRCLQGDNAQEGIRAFSEKRSPKFRG